MTTTTGPDATNIIGHTKTHPATKKSVLGSAQDRPVTIVLVGETGSGKASFVTLLVDLFMGTEVLELVDLHKETDTSEPGEAPSPTTEVTLHKINTLDGPLVQILETVDLGTKDNSSSITKIRDVMQSDIQQVDAVIIVADGHTAHLTDDTLAAITEIFPRTLVDNIALVFPDSDKRSWKFETDSLLPELRTTEHWLFHNPLAWVRSYWMTKKERPDDTQAAEEIIDELKRQYGNTVKTLGGWLGWVNSRSTRPTHQLCNPLDFKTKFKENFSGIESNLDRLRTEKAVLQELRNGPFQLEYEGTQSEMTQLEKDIRELKAAIKELERELDRLRRPTVIIPGIPADVDLQKRLDLEERIPKKKNDVKYFEEKVIPTLYRAVKAKGDIDIYIRIIIFRELNEFYEKSFHRKFSSDIKAIIQTLEDRKVIWEPKEEYEAERKAVDDIVQMLTEKLHGAGE